MDRRKTSTAMCEKHGYKFIGLYHTDSGEAKYQARYSEKRDGQQHDVLAIWPVMSLLDDVEVLLINHKAKLKKYIKEI